MAAACEGVLGRRVSEGEALHAVAEWLVGGQEAGAEAGEDEVLDELEAVGAMGELRDGSSEPPAPNSPARRRQP